MEPAAAVEELTGGAFTGLEDLSEQFTGLTAPGLRQFLLDLLTPELGGPEAPVLSGMPLMNLLAGMEGVRLDLLMGLLTALQSGESAPAAGDPAANPEAQAALQTAQAAQAASGTAPDAPSAPVTVAQMGNMPVIGRDLPGVEAQSYHLYPSGKAALQGVQQDAAGAVLPFGAGVDKYRLHSATSFIPSGEGKNRTSPTAVS